MFEAIDLSIEKENINNSFQENTINKVNDDSVVRSHDSSQDNECLFSPPKKKLKQDQLKFPKVSKIIENSNTQSEVSNDNENAIDLTTDANKMEVESATIDDDKCLKSESDQKNGINKTLNDSVEGAKPVTSPTSQDTSPKVVLSKEERKKLKEQREQEKAIRMKELEEKRQKREEEKKKREEEKKKREEEKKKREAEKERKEQERKEKERLKEEERKKKEEEKKVKEIEKKKKEELKEIEKEKREAERKLKEADKERKENEKRIEEEKRKQEEEALRRKKEKAANQFKSFFTKKSLKPKEKEPVEEMFVRFKPFQMTANMTLAPICRNESFRKMDIDKYMEKDDVEHELYINELKTRKQSDEFKKYISRRSLRKAALEEKRLKKLTNKKIEKKDIIVLSDDEGEDDSIDKDNDENDIENNSFNEPTSKNIYKAKFLQFSENTRPAYYGTWTKKTNRINGRKIHGLDNEIFNYEIDSDEEWIDEPGEDLSDDNPDEEEEKDDKETEDDQDGFFVPHGYLSDDEGVHDSNGEEEDEEGDGETEKESHATKNSSQAREQDKLKMKASSFEAEMRKQIRPKKPICIGIVYESHPSLSSFGKIHFVDNPDDKEDESVLSPSNTPKNAPSTTPKSIPEEAMPHFVRFLHGNSDGLSKLIPAFQELWLKYVEESKIDCRTSISKKQIIKKVQEISSRINDTKFGKICYIVNDEVLMQYEHKDENLPVVNVPDVSITIGETNSEEIVT